MLTSAVPPATCRMPGWVSNAVHVLRDRKGWLRTQPAATRDHGPGSRTGSGALNACMPSVAASYKVSLRKLPQVALQAILICGGRSEGPVFSCSFSHSMLLRSRQGCVAVAAAAAIVDAIAAATAFSADR